MPRDEDYRLVVLLALIVVVAFAAIFTLNRVLPDRSLQCVKAGGQWQTEGDGHCERAGK